MHRPIYLVHQLSQGIEPIRITEVNLELVVERFLIPILPRRSFSRHGYLDARRLAEFLKYFGGIFASLIRMDEVRPRMIHEATHHRLQSESTRMHGHHGRSDNFSGEHIHDGGKIHEPIFPEYVCEVRDPNLVDPLKLRDNQEIRELLVFPWFCPFPGLSLASVRLDAVKLHDSQDAFFVDVQCCGQSFTAVTRMVVQHGLDELLGVPVLRGLLRFVVERAS